MFYIDNKLKNRKKDLALIHLGPTLVVLVAFLSLTVLYSGQSRSALRTLQARTLNTKAEQTRDDITERLTVYENVARAGSGLFEASDSVSRAEWSSFISSFDLTNRYPGVQIIGYIDVLIPSEVEAHTLTIQNEGYSSYAIRPSGQRELYTAILYAEPANETNISALGLDTYTEHGRRKAMDMAASTGKTTVTDPVKSLLDDTVTAFTMYVPVYKKGSNPQNEQQRLQFLVGYIFVGFRANDLFKNIAYTGQNDLFGFMLSDNDVTDNPILYASPTYDGINSLSGKYTQQLSFFVANQGWTVTEVSDPAVIPARDRNGPRSSFWAGVLFSVLIAGSIYLLLVNRTQNFKRKEGQVIQSAKDELLALASHQLRTPATGVKQYIGMLREGYVGKLTSEQRKYINKAYASNERQLNTINEMLVVAHADAGNLDLRIEKIDMTKMMQEIIDEQCTAFKEKNQDLQVILPKRKVYIEMDQRYLRMAIENVISNATKYTEDYGRVRISMNKSANAVYVVVRDSGVGVDAGDFPLLFKKFSRIPNDLTGKVTGSGIGLYLAKKIVKAHNGSIEFTSRLGRGSKCVISIPIKNLNPEM